MKRVYFFLLTFLALAQGAHAQHFFTAVDKSSIQLPASARPSVWQPNQYAAVQADVAGLSAVVASAPMEQTSEARAGKTVISVPQPDGSFEEFAIWRIMTCEPVVYERHPEIRTFSGISLVNSRKTLRGTITLRGISLMQMLPDFGIIYVEPLADGQTTYYRVYDRKDIPQNLIPAGLTRGVADNAPQINPPMTTLPTATVEDRGASLERVQYKVYRYIVSCTAEFTIDNGNTKELAFAAVVQYSNEVSAFFERDVSIRLQLLGESEKVIYTDPDTDPFNGTTVFGWMGANTLIVNTAVGTNNYDIGHVYARYMGGPAIGVAGGIGNVCSDSKGAGCSAGIQNVYGDGFRNVIGQEVGHQLGGGHSWNRCGGGDGRTGNSAFEPGSGSTIMSYAGACGSDNVQNYSDLYFHAGSIEEIQFIATFGSGAFCGTYEDKNNNKPEVTLPYQNDFFIPILTPFELKGSATDPDGDNTLTYCWEQMNTGPEIPLGTQQDDAPIFRTRPAVSNSNRVFPRMQTILANGTDKTELMANNERNFKFRLTVRDNVPDEAGLAWKDVTFRTVGAAGPFLVSYPNTNSVSWKSGEYVEVTWDVAGTFDAPINCKKVNIVLSTDGGLTWPITLATEVANDGSQSIKVPDIQTNQARLRINAADNIFFDVSNANFKIVAATQPQLSVGLSDNSAVICLPNSFSSQILTNGLLGYNKPIELALTGTLPPGATATLSTTNLLPGESGSVNIDLNNVVVAGTWNIGLNVTSDNNTIELPITLTTITNDFTGQAQVAPADGASGLVQSQILRWTKGNDATSYDMQLATSPSFAPGTIIASRSATTIDTFKIPFLLSKSTAYYWRIRPNNACSPHRWSDPYFFATLTENCASFSPNDLPKNIGAGSATTIETKIDLGQGVSMSDVNVKNIKGYHDYFSDLDVRLISPQGTEVQLFKNRCPGISVAFNFGFDDSAPGSFTCPPGNVGNFVKPQTPLSALIGESSTGVWTLRVKDTQPGGGGTLEEFQLDICSAFSLDPPYLVKNNVMSIEQGTNKVLDADLLQVDDNNNTHSELVYTLLTTPTDGELRKNGIVLQPGDQFTQADIDDNVLRYYDWATTLAQTCFKFVVTDGEGGFLGTLNYCVQPFTTGVNDLQNTPLHFSVVPNPATDQVTVALSQPASDELSVQVLDMSGRLLTTTRIPAGHTRLTMPAAEWPRGMYMIQIRSNRDMAVEKVVVR